MAADDEKALVVHKLDSSDVAYVLSFTLGHGGTPHQVHFSKTIDLLTFFSSHEFQEIENLIGS